MLLSFPLLRSLYNRLRFFRVLRVLYKVEFYNSPHLIYNKMSKEYDHQFTSNIYPTRFSSLYLFFSLLFSLEQSSTQQKSLISSIKSSFLIYNLFNLSWRPISSNLLLTHSLYDVKRYLKAPNFEYKDDTIENLGEMKTINRKMITKTIPQACVTNEKAPSTASLCSVIENLYLKSINQFWNYESHKLRIYLSN